MKCKLSLGQAWTALIFMAVIVPVLTIIVAYGYQFYKKQLKSELMIERQSNELLMHHIESKITDLKTLLSSKSEELVSFVSQIDKKESVDNIQKILALIVDRELVIKEVMITSVKSEVLAAIDSDLNITTTLPSKAELQSVLVHWGFDKSYEYPEFVIPSMGRTYISSPKQHGDYFSFVISVPVAYPVLAVLMAKIDINEIWKKGFKDETINSYLLDRRGSLITGITNSDYNPGDLMTHLEIARNSLINNKWSIETSYIGVNDKPVFGTLTSIPSLNWSLISEIPVTKIIQPIIDLLIEIAYYSIIMIIIFIAIAMYLVKKTIRPVQEICEAIDNVAEGNYCLLLNKCNIVELDAMMLGFNNMLNSRHRAEIASEERTKELAEEKEALEFEIKQRQKIEQESDRLGKLLEESSNEIYLFEPETFKFITVNQSARSNLGYSIDELQQLTPVDIKPEFTDIEFTSLIQPLLAGEKSSISFETVHERKNGETYPVEVRLQYSNTAQPPVFIAIIDDVTERKAAEQVRFRYQQQLEEQVVERTKELTIRIRCWNNLLKRRSRQKIMQ